MKYEISLHISLKDEKKTEVSFDLMQKLGINYFNTWCNDEIFPLSEERDIAIAKMLHKKIRETKISMSSFHFVGSVLDCGDISQRRVREYMNRSLCIFGECCPNSFVVHPGTFAEGGFQCNKSAHKAAVEAWGEKKVHELLVENLRYFGERAGEYHTKIAVENLFQGRFYSEIGSLLQLVEEVNSPYVGFCFDSGHANVDGLDCADVIRRMGKKLFEVHLHDNFGDKDAHLPIGFGNINWYRVIDALKEIAYEGTASFEFFRWPLGTVEEGVRHCAAMWENLEYIACHGYDTTELG